MEISFSLYPARYYATPRHNHRSDFYKNGLKSSARLEGKKVKKFQRKKITTGRDITKNVEGGGGFRPPPGSFRVKDLAIHTFRLDTRGHPGRPHATPRWLIYDFSCHGQTILSDSNNNVTCSYSRLVLVG